MTMVLHDSQSSLGRDLDSLADLAADANAEHQQVLGALGTALRHAIAAGEILRVARVKVGGGWIEWVKANLQISYTTTLGYIRLATYRDQLVDLDRLTIDGALEHLRELPPSRDPAAFQFKATPLPDSAIEEARTMAANGVSYSEIAKRLGVSAYKIRASIDPGFNDAHKERARARRPRYRVSAQADRHPAVCTGSLVDARVLIHQACLILADYVATEHARATSPERAVTKALWEARRIIDRLTAPQTSSGMVLRCDCGFVAENVSVLVLHTYRRHDRLPTVVERTPIANEICHV